MNARARALRAGAPALAALALIATAGAVRADAPVPPWVDDVPLASWARSVAPRPGERGEPGDLVLLEGPDRASGRRGVTAAGASLPIFGARRGPGCIGRWWLVGPLAWTCSDDAVLLPDEPTAAYALPAAGADGLSRQYFFVGRDDADAYDSLDSVQEGTPDRQLEHGWAVAVVGQRELQGEPWAHTSKGLWIAMRDLVAARPSSFHGEVVRGGSLDGVSWTVGGRVVRPSLAPPPAEVTRPGERWIDVDLATQTLVAYEGTVPVYATLVSTGRGAPGTDSATPVGVHRIWVKLLVSDMDDVEREDLESHYSLEDVPYVQFFDRSVALHGTYWHHDFGHVKSHGCVNLSPPDARWLFDFTGPRLPPGWVAAYPTPEDGDAGTLVRVH